jgi:hypothetical protein
MPALEADGAHGGRGHRRQGQAGAETDEGEVHHSAPRPESAVSRSRPSTAPPQDEQADQHRRARAEPAVGRPDTGAVRASATPIGSARAGVGGRRLHLLEVGAEVDDRADEREEHDQAGRWRR